jgi:hypothetical protein
VVVLAAGRPVSVMAFTVVGLRVVAIDALGDPERLRQVDLGALGDPTTGTARAGREDDQADQPPPRAVP